MIGYRSEWQALAKRIDGLIQAGSLFVRLSIPHQSDPHNTITTELLPHASSICDGIRHFWQSHTDIPPTFQGTFARFFRIHQRAIDQIAREPIAGDGVNLLRSILPALASLKAEIEYLLTDTQAITRRLTERAFAHLQRSIIADPVIRQKWEDAFSNGEVACEKLGAVHLLSHGIWAFKPNAAGERTDLVLGEPLLDFTHIQVSADALVLTEWKKVTSQGECIQQVQSARHQAECYASSILYGFELTSYRYLVMVSDHQYSLPDDEVINGVVYRNINIAVTPDTPSRRRDR